MSVGTITGTFTGATGTPATGFVYFTPATAVLNTSTDTVILPDMEKVELDAYGSFSVELQATDDPALNPINFTYRVSTELEVDGVKVRFNSFHIQVPTDSTQYLADIAPVPSSDGVQIVKGDKGDQGLQGIQGVKGDPGGLVEGVLLAHGADWNLLLTDGLYRVIGDLPHASTPPSGQLYGTLEVLTSQGTGRVIQTYYSQISGEGGRVNYQRVLAGGVWYGWYLHASSRVSTTAGRAIYQWDDKNGREQLIYGDTGWRQVVTAGTITNMPNMTVFMRRVGSRVDITTVEGVGGGTASGAVSLFTPTTGFRSVTGQTNPPMLFGAPVVDEGAVLLTASSIYSVSVTYTVYLRATSGKRHYGTLSYLTNDPWPTSLPGTALGSIPNA